MSTGANIWRDEVSLVAHSPRVANPIGPGGSKTSARSDPALVALVHQLLSFQRDFGKKRIFFAGAGPDSTVGEFCRRIGDCLAGTVTANVALVRSGEQKQDGTSDGDNRETDSSDEMLQLAPNFWSVPFEVFQRQWEQTRSAGVAARYEYAVFGADVSDSMAPAFSRCCDAAVLIISANQTRREVALRAKELLADWNANLLGAVLDNRTFPIPESIYRRL